MEIRDFGEKIGGAKKDLWRERGLLAGDLAEMNRRETDSYVKKDNVWKKPDYQAMVDGGMPRDVAYFIKLVRDSLATKPQYFRGDETPENRLDRQRQYIETVREVKNAVESIRTKEDAMHFFDTYVVANGYIEVAHGSISGPRRSVTEKGKENAALNNKAFNSMLVSTEYSWQRKVSSEAERAQFGVPKQDKVPTGYTINQYDADRTIMRNPDEWEPNTYYVAKGYSTLKKNILSYAEALKWAQDAAKGQTRKGKTRFVPEQLAHVRRTGPDYRQRRDATGEQYLHVFGFRGGEFGNWMGPEDRQTSLNMGFDALKDLAAALQISDKDISFQGELSIAFGARGSGKAVAHYEPLRQVINLTKMHGAGSLGHEWWHGLDDYLGKQLGMGKMLSTTPYKYDPMQKLLNVISRKPCTPEQAQNNFNVQWKRQAEYAGREIDSVMLYGLQRLNDDGVMQQYNQLKTNFLKGEKGATDKLNDFRKTYVGRVIPKKERDDLLLREGILVSYAQRPNPPVSFVPTEYYKNSKEMGNLHEKDGGYWDSNEELTARAFACYVKDKLSTLSDYLVGHAESCIGIRIGDKDGDSVIKAYPEGMERMEINAAFDELFSALKQEQILQHQAAVAPQPAPVPNIVSERADEQLSLFELGNGSSEEEMQRELYRLTIDEMEI